MSMFGGGFFGQGAIGFADSSTDNRQTLVSKQAIVLSGDERFPNYFESTFHGRMSIGAVMLIIVGMGLFYVWTHNIQGGG